MKSGKVWRRATWLTWLTSISAQDLVSTLGAQSDLVLFNSYIQSFPNLLNTLTNITNCTVLAPSDTAITRFVNGVSPPPTQDKIEATLFYHILHGSYPLGTFSATPMFPSSYLSNSSWTNLTGGAVVELVENGGTPVVLSALKATSAINQGNVNANGGVIHIIDTVLSIPQDEAATVIEAGMESYKNILTAGGYLTGQANDKNIALGEAADMTFFIPNSAKAQHDFSSITSGWSTDQLNDLLFYHAVPGIVAYSSLLHNGTVLPTVQGGEITIYEGENGTMYANQVQIMSTDYLTSNGVLHTLDGVLNPNNITQPTFPPAPEKKKVLSIGVIAGIAVGGVCFLFAIVAAVLLLRRRRASASVVHVEDGVGQTTKPSQRNKKNLKINVSERPPPNDRNRSNRSTANGRNDRGSRNQSHRGSAGKGRQRSLSQQQIELEKTKAAEVRRVVSQQMDAFRRTGYIDASTPKLGRAIAVPVVPALPIAELPAVESPLGRYELFGGEELFLPVIEEDAQELAAHPSRMARHQSLESGEDLILGISQPTTPLSDVFKQPSRASSRAMVLDRL